MNLSIKYKIAFLSILTALLPVIVLLSLTSVKKDNVNSKLQIALDNFSKMNTGQISKNVLVLCEQTERFMQENTSIDFRGSLIRKIMETKVGKSGHVFVISGYGYSKGKYIVSKNGEQDGENVWEAKDSEGRLFIQSLIAKANALTEDEVAYEEYQLQDEGEKGSRTQIAALTYFEPWGWVIGASTYKDDFTDAVTVVDDSLSSLMLWSVLGGLIIVAIMISISLYMGRKITNPLIDMTLKAELLAAGDLDQRIDHIAEDETGRLATALNDMVDNIRNILKGIVDNTTRLQNTANDFSNVSMELSEKAESLNQKTASTASASEEMSINMSSVSSNVEQASNTINIMATSTGEMGITVQEISINTEKARQITSEAVISVNRASTQIGELGDAANEISKVIDVVIEIAEQTKLLALNATIEAARAGESGKGFAVVANEVKELAKQTNEATEEIRKRIEAIQGSTSKTVAEIGHINEVINNVNDIVSNIAASVEEQAVTSKDIAVNVNQAADGITEVKTNISSAASVSKMIATDISVVSDVSVMVESASKIVNNNALDLVSIGDALKGMVNKFKFQNN